MNNTLPHPRTLSKWYLESALNGEPGILTESINTLRSASKKMKEEGKTLVGSLSFDEMAIRRHLEYVNAEQRFSGYIHCGKTLPDGQLPIANQILVFMFTSLHEKTSIPVAYYGIKSLDKSEKRDLIIEILTELHHTGVKVVNITFDGLMSNRGACELLGASFDVRNIVPFFKHPVDGSNVYILLDSCHMLKLLRNALGDLKSIKDPKLGKILWNFFVALESFRKSNFITHRLTKKHIQYGSNKMNVRLAAQTFSSSVAKGMDHLKAIGYESFQSCDATIEFCTRINDLFDITNSKKIRSDNIYKSALNPSNAEKIFEFFENMSSYIRSLKFNKKFCVASKRKTGFIGFLVNMMSIESLYKDLVTSGILENLPTFYLSQDPLESFFSRVRSLHGANDNPTLQQVKSAMRKLLFLNEITSNEFANCEDNLNILTVSSAKSRLIHQQPANSGIVEGDEEDAFWENLMLEDENVVNEAIRLEERDKIAEEFTIAFFAAKVEKNIQSKQFECADCQNIFNVNHKIEGIFSSMSQRPCKSTFLICKLVYKYENDIKNKAEFNYQTIVNRTLNSVNNLDLFAETYSYHQDNQHKNFMIESIIHEFIRIYSTYIARNVTLEQQKLLLRNRNKRATIFSGQ